jgi:Amt family ammonium transporter
VDATIQPSQALDALRPLAAAALLGAMALGFALLDAGQAQAGRRLRTLVRGLVLFGLSALAYVLVGSWLMYPVSGNGLIPGLDWGQFLARIAWPPPAGAWPQSVGPDAALADLIFQATLAATAAAVAWRAFAGRARSLALLIFAPIMAALIYALQGYWVWGGGVLAELGVRDLGGSGVVHLCGGAAALAGVLWLGSPRAGGGGQAQGAPRRLALIVPGILILWAGLIGIDLGAGIGRFGDWDQAPLTQILVNGNLAAAAGALVGLVAGRVLLGRGALALSLQGALAGLVAIAAGPMALSPLLAALIGAGGGALAVLSMAVLPRLGIDDRAGAVSVHGTVGIWGLLAVPLASPESIGVGAILGFAYLAALTLWTSVRLVVGIRPRERAAAPTPSVAAEPVPAPSVAAPGAVAALESADAAPSPVAPLPEGDEWPAVTQQGGAAPAESTPAEHPVVPNDLDLGPAEGAARPTGIDSGEALPPAPRCDPAGTEGQVPLADAQVDSSAEPATEPAPQPDRTQGTDPAAGESQAIGATAQPV